MYGTIGFGWYIAHEGDRALLYVRDKSLGWSKPIDITDGIDAIITLLKMNNRSSQPNSVSQSNPNQMRNALRKWAENPDNRRKFLEDRHKFPQIRTYDNVQECIENIPQAVIGQVYNHFIGK